MRAFWTVRSRIALAFGVLGTAQVSLIAAITLIVVPLPAIQREFGLSAAQLALLSAAYGLSFGGLLLVGGRLTDRLGARRTFVAGMSIFGTSSLFGALATAHALVLGARFAQGIGAALVAPAAVAMVTRLYPEPRQRTRAFAVWGTLSVTGAVAGTVLSGMISAVGSWRWTFLLPTLLAMITVAGARHLPSVTANAAARLRIVDGVLATAGLLTLSYGVLKAVPLLIIAGVVVLGGFIARQAHLADPLLPIRLVINPARAAALLVIWLTAAASTTTTFLLSLYFQQIQGHTPLMTSMAFLPFLLIIAMGPISGRLTDQYGVRPVTVLGLLLAATSMILLNRIDADSTYAGVTLAALILFPVGAGLAFSGATVTALANVPAERSGVAGGLANTAMEVGPTVGLALSLALASARTDALRGEGLNVVSATTGGYVAVFAATAVAFVITAAVVRYTFRKDKTQ